MLRCPAHSVDNVVETAAYNYAPLIIIFPLPESPIYG